MAEKRMEIIPAGTLLIVSAGEYSDYNVMGLFRVLKDINADSLREEYLRSRPEQRETYHFKEAEFLATVSPFVEQMNAWEWHLTSYSTAEEMWVAKDYRGDVRDKADL